MSWSSKKRISRVEKEIGEIEAKISDLDERIRPLTDERSALEERLMGLGRRRGNSVNFQNERRSPTKS